MENVILNRDGKKEKNDLKYLRATSQLIETIFNF